MSTALALRSFSSPVAGCYHASVKNVGRTSGRSVVAAAAYRHGERLHDERTGHTFDYRARGGVVDSFIIANGPAWAQDRARLWNEAERTEQRANGLIATELELALPHELGAAARKQLLHDFLGPVVTKYGLAADVAIHAPGAGRDHRNIHAHVLISHRQLGPEGFIEKVKGQRKDIGLSNFAMGSEAVIEIRQAWEQAVNRAYERAGLNIYVDHRSHADRGIVQEPTQHLGPKASGIERRGESSERGDVNRAIVAENAALAALVAERDQVTAQIISLTAHREAQSAMEQAEAARIAAAEAAAEQHRRDVAKKAEAEHQVQAEQAAQQRQEVERVATLAREAQAAELARLETVKLDQLRELQARAAAYVREQERQAEEAKRERAEREKAERAEAEQARDGAIRNASDRYAQALGQHYDVMNPYSSLARAAMAEAGAFNKDQEALRSQAAEEKDPAKRELLTLRREIERSEHLAQSGERVARINETLTGQRDDHWKQFAADRSAEAVTLREQYNERAAEQARAQAQQRQAEPQRAFGGREQRRELIRQSLEHERQRGQTHERDR